MSPPSPPGALRLWALEHGGAAQGEGDLTAGGYTVFNLGASYSTRVAGKELTLRAALTNLANKRYWGFQYAGYVQPADPRAVSLTAKIAY